MRRIQSKITITYVFLTLLAIATFSLIASLASEEYLTRKKIDDLSRRIDVIAGLIQPEVDSLLVYRQIVNLALAADLRITLIADDGRVIVDSEVPLERTNEVENHLQRPEIQQSLHTAVGTHTRLSTTVKQQFLYVAKVVRLSERDGELGNVKFVRLSSHLGDIQAMAGGARSAIIVAGLLVLAVVVLVSVFISRRISKPMEVIAAAVEEIRAGNLETRINVTSDDEVGRVAQAVNEMVAKLKSDIVQLTRLERVRSEFLGNVSHELRTPIFSLQGFLETLIEGAVDDPTVNRNFLQKAYNHSVRLNTLLGELITISQIESGEMKMSFRYFNLYEFLHALVEEFRATAEQHAVRLALQAGVSRQIEVLGDKERLRVVFENLFENAIKYNKPGGEVVVSFEQDGERAILKVADTGVGIAQQHLSRIFERFYRVDKDRSREVGGTGLGLAIVKHIIEAHGAAVKVESEVGKGSIFSFWLKM